MKTNFERKHKSELYIVKELISILLIKIDIQNSIGYIYILKYILIANLIIINVKNFNYLLFAKIYIIL